MSFLRALFLWLRLMREGYIVALYRDPTTHNWYVMVTCDEDKVDECLSDTGSMRYGYSIMEYLVFTTSRPLLVRFYQPESPIERLLAKARGEV